MINPGRASGKVLSAAENEGADDIALYRVRYAAASHVFGISAQHVILARRGGPQRLTAFVRSLGDGITRFDRYETAAGKRSGVPYTTTPRAIVSTVRALLLSDV